MENNEFYFQEKVFLEGLDWSSESISELSSKISERINSYTQNPIFMGLADFFILLKVFRDEGHSEYLLDKYSAVAGEVTKRFNFTLILPIPRN